MIFQIILGYVLSIDLTEIINESWDHNQWINEAEGLRSEKIYWEEIQPSKGERRRKKWKLEDVLRKSKAVKPYNRGERKY